MNAENLAAAIRNLQVLCVGQVTHDRYGDEFVAGGCAFFGARCAHALGARVRLLTSFGEDFTRQADLAGLDVHAVQRGRTTVFTNTYPPGGHRVQRIESVSAPLVLQDLPHGWQEADVLLLAPVFGEIDPAHDWFSRIRARVRAACLQGFMKTAGPAGAVVAGEPLSRRPFSLAGADAFFLSEEDIACFGDPGLLDFLRARAACVFVTGGEKGCDVLTRDGAFHVGIYPTSAMDPTGAGDTFAGACSLALAAGADPLTAARLGAAAASVVVEFQGSREMPRVAEAWKRFSTFPG